ncbi:hypothetical protein PTKIN_Ptkin13bG0131000 [Pterospermum kingtungense]
MSTFPTDLMTYILCQPPVKTLLRFKCVSKPWGYLIDDLDFAKLHLHQSMKTNTNVKLLLDNRIDKDDMAYSVHFDSLCNLVQFPRPFTAKTIKYHSRIIGSCHGLIVVYHRDAGIALWNPSTRQCHYLPTMDDDDITKDHDIIPGYAMTETPYSDLANSWRRIKDCPYDIPFNYNDGAYLNGRLHWEGDEIGDRRLGKLIFALDLGTEEYHVLPGADIDFSCFGYKNVGVLGECLCVFHDYLCGFLPDHVVLWLMKEYGVTKSWTKIIKLPRDKGEWFTNIFHTRAEAYSRNGDKILLDCGGGYQPTWFNVEDKTGETLQIPGAVPQRFSAITFMESLVSVLPMND